MINQFRSKITLIPFFYHEIGYLCTKINTFILKIELKVKKMIQDRLKMLLDMLLSDPSDAFVQYAVAKEYENLGQWEQALSTYLSLQQLDADYVGMYYHLGKLYEKLDNVNSALETYDLGIRVAKKLSDFHALSELNTAKVNLEMEL